MDYTEELDEKDRINAYGTEKDKRLFQVAAQCVDKITTDDVIDSKGNIIIKKGEEVSIFVVRRAKKDGEATVALLCQSVREAIPPPTPRPPKPQPKNVPAKKKSSRKKGKKNNGKGKRRKK